MNGWENDLVEKLSFLKALDLSICDLGTVDGVQLAAALTRHPHGTLESLKLAGNYRMSEAIPDLVKVYARLGVIEWDCSFCDVLGTKQAPKGGLRSVGNGATMFHSIIYYAIRSN